MQLRFSPSAANYFDDAYLAGWEVKSECIHHRNNRGPIERAHPKVKKVMIVHERKRLKSPQTRFFP